MEDKSAQNDVAAASVPDRDRHLFSKGRKRILALDGGGVRGAMTIAFLERLEELIAEIEGRPVRLCDWFDLVGGTSRFRSGWKRRRLSRRRPARKFSWHARRTRAARANLPSGTRITALT